MSNDDPVVRDARLTMLKELNKQPNRSMTSTAMRIVLEEAFLLRRTREWVEAQFDYLAEMEAVRLTPAGTIKIATLTEHGRSHLALRAFIAGVLSPSEPVL